MFSFRAQNETLRKQTMEAAKVLEQYAPPKTSKAQIFKEKVC